MLSSCYIQGVPKKTPPGLSFRLLSPCWLILPDMVYLFRGSIYAYAYQVSILFTYWLLSCSNLYNMPIAHITSDQRLHHDNNLDFLNKCFPKLKFYVQYSIPTVEIYIDTMPFNSLKLIIHV